MTQAQRIRRYVLKHYVDPARTERKAELTIRAGDVCRAMEFNGRVPNVCSVLGSRKFSDMAGLRLLDRAGPRQSTTTTFRYALVEPPTGAAPPPTAPERSAKHGSEECRTAAAPHRGRGGNQNLTVVIACAGTKSASAGHLKLGNGRRVKFVADPRAAPRDTSTSYRHPDDVAYAGLTWRQVLVEYNRDPTGNPLGLLPAWRLYEPPAYPSIYADLVEAYGAESVFVLSAGWGLVGAGFLLPDYDITFAANAESYKQRGKGDRFEDLAMLPTDSARTVVFLGGQSYVPLFCALTKNVVARRIVFHYSVKPPSAPNCERCRFQAEDAKPRTWHYQCANALIRGAIGVEGAWSDARIGATDA